ncbi:2-oxoglutarate ferredoxin oxidoreductase subunit alpha [candidate division BRC1 bacterium SM23_51]|nr:MAG: 2-oxoglutarate ferredoxin oxidoreductase subunit alpha [candidate division BRC1 bacterium SM23_51]
MNADAQGVLTGAHFLSGNQACCEGALAAGCRFVAGYPITPSTDIVERIAVRFPLVGGTFIQMEDEMASSIAILGAAWAGAKAMTVTSGPGFSLMMEHIGLAAMTETPCVFVNVQRGGPSTGLPTLPGQADLMQARWGSHGDYEIIALSPNSPQETFEMTIEAFNLAEKYRTPVMVMTDECVGHMTEKVVIPPADEIELQPRRYTTLPPEEYQPFRPDADLVPPMVKVGDGYHVHVTGLTHDERGYPVINAECQQELVQRLVDKIRRNTDAIVSYEEYKTDDCEIALVSFGITSRVASRAVEMARAEGLPVGMVRLKVIWPFPEKEIRQLAERVRSFVVAEMNLGQMVYEVERCAAGRAKTFLAPHAGGTVHSPQQILERIREAAE